MIIGEEIDKHGRNWNELKGFIQLDKYHNGSIENIPIFY